MNNYDPDYYEDKGYRDRATLLKYIGDVTIQDLIDAGIHNPKDSTYSSDYSDCFSTNFFSEHYIHGSSRRDEGIVQKKCLTSGRFTDIPEDWKGYGWSFRNEVHVDAPELMKIDWIREYAEPIAKKFNEEFKELFGQMINNLKKEKSTSTGKMHLPWDVMNIYNSNFLFKRNGDIIELLDTEIEKSQLDSKNGLYIIEGHHFETSKAKWQWPSNGPVIKTEYYQKFTFDVATNDLVDYKFYHHSDEIQYK